jgi:ribosomal protein S18 acetylase RimI-like enzyme
MISRAPPRQRGIEMDIEIREADLTDESQAEAVCRLLDEYARLPIAQGAPLAVDVLRELVPGLLKHPAALVLLAWIEGQAVGVAVCFLGFSTFQARPLVNIHDLAVTTECRGHGVGQRLLEAVEAKARALGCGKVTLEVRESNTAARRLYRRFGFGDREGGPATLFLSKNLQTG